MFEEKIEVFYETVIQTWKDVNNFLEIRDTFQKRWKFIFPSIGKCQCLCEEAKKEIIMMKPKLLNKSLKCVVIGKVSSGKSTLVNALLLKRVLPSGFSCRTNSFIEVKRSCSERSYISIGNEEKSIDLLKGLVDDFSPDALPQGSHIELFYSSDNDSLLSEDIIIIDTPGFDDLLELDHIIIDKCSDSDVLILVVSSIVGFGETERNFIKKYQTVFSKFNILILYSFWDKPQLENIERSNNMRKRLFLQAKQYLQKDLHVPEEDTEDKIFFVSAEEKLMSLSNMSENNDQYIQYRHDEFEKFLKCLQIYMSKNSFNRRLGIIEDIKDIFNQIINEIEFCIEEINIKRAEFSIKLQDDLRILDDFNKKINVEIEILFKEAYNHFFDKALEIIKSEVIQNDEEIVQKLSILLQESVDVSVESLKIRILNLVEIENDEHHELCNDILKVLYFPYYFNMENKIECSEMNLLRKSFVEINRVKKIGTTLSIGGAVLGTAATLATGGIVAGIVLPIPTLFGASVLGFSGAAVGAGTAGGVSNALIALNREAFGYFYKNEEKIIKKIWKDMEEYITNSYSLFLEELSIQVEHIIVPLKEEFYAFPNKINFLKSEASRMHNLH